MAINLVCKVCKSNLSVRSRLCKNCGYDFSNGKKYKVVVKCKDGRRISKVLDSISIAKKLERKLKTQSMENSLFGITEIPVIDEIWGKYLTSTFIYQIKASKVGGGITVLWIYCVSLGFVAIGLIAIHMILPVHRYGCIFQTALTFFREKSAIVLLK